MILVGATDTSISYRRPAPVFIAEERPLSTKKSRGTPRFALPPKAPVKSCPVTRIFSRITDTDRPQPVSFREDSDTSFIVQSAVYSPEKSELYFEQCYVIEERLGCGSFGEVFRVRSKEDGQQYACKRSLLKFRGEGDRRRRMEEVQKHEKLPKHRNCVEFYRAWEERQQLYLLTEVCHTSLEQLADKKHELPEYTIWEYLVDLLQGVSHLHKNNLVHMDIKPENIFFGYDGLCKLGDFGLVIDISQGPVIEAAEGDPKYLAPEVMNLQFGPPADIFSLGMTVLELATDLDLPKQGEAWQMLRQGTLPPAANRLSHELQSVLSGFLHPNPVERLTADQALALTSIRRHRRYKTFRDYCRRSVERAHSMVSATWLYMVVLLASITRPFTSRLYHHHTDDTTTPPAPSSLHRHHNNSNINHSDSDFSLGFSDDEGLDHSMAQPLGDISSSSNEAVLGVGGGGMLGRRYINSTPIGYKYSQHHQSFNASPAIRHSFNESQVVLDSPFLFRGRTPLSRPHQLTSTTQKNVNNNLQLDISNHHQQQHQITSSTQKNMNSSGDLQLDTSNHHHHQHHHPAVLPLNTSSPKVQSHEESMPTFNLTSRNLIDLFNAAESDED